MDDIKDKAKVFIKKFSSPFSTTSKFKGQGHRLGSMNNSSSSMSAATPSRAPAPTISSKTPGSDGSEKKQLQKLASQQRQQQGEWQKIQQEKWERERSPGLPQGRETVEVGRETMATTGVLSSRVQAQLSIQSSDRGAAGDSQSPNLMSGDDLAPRPSESAGFDPYSPVIGARKGSGLLYSQEKKFQCPICQSWWRSEGEISSHVEECLAKSVSLQEASSTTGPMDKASRESFNIKDTTRQESREAASMLLSGAPSNATLDVIVRLLRNIRGDPNAQKFRKLRLGNPSIRDTVGTALGGVEFLESVGFHLIADGEEVVAVMDVPSQNQMERIVQAIGWLEPHVSVPTPSVTSLSSQQLSDATWSVPQKVDRQMRLFYALEDNQAGRIELPESFFVLSAAELKMEATARKKKLEDGQLLIPKSYREKQAFAARRQYKATTIRVQFPDGVVLQGLFLPEEPTTALYQFVASALIDGSTPFELSLPITSKSRVVLSPLQSGGEVVTLEEAELVPTALLKFRSLGLRCFTGVRADYLGLCEPLTSTPFPESV